MGLLLGSPLSESKNVNLDWVNNPLIAEEQAKEEKRLAISKIAQEARDLQDNIFKASEGMQQYMFAHMSTEYLIALSKITNPDTRSPEPITQSVRVFAVNEFNEKFNKEAVLVYNKAKLLQMENKATTVDILLSIELNEVEEELVPHIIKDNHLLDIKATEARLKNLRAEGREQLLQNENTYKYPFLVHFFRTHFKEEYEGGLQHVYNTYRRDLSAVEIRDLSSLNDVFKKNKDFMLIAVRNNGYALRYAHEALKKDKDIVFAAVRQTGWALGQADEDLRKDRDVVLAAVQKDSIALFFADEDLKKDRGIVLAAVKQFGHALGFAHVDLRKDRDVVLVAVSQDGKALQYADEILKKDQKIVLAAVQQNGDALQFADEILKKDSKFMKKFERLRK